MKFFKVKQLQFVSSRNATATVDVNLDAGRTDHLLVVEILQKLNSFIFRTDPHFSPIINCRKATILTILRRYRDTSEVAHRHQKFVEESLSNVIHLQFYQEIFKETQTMNKTNKYDGTEGFLIPDQPTTVRLIPTDH